MHTFKGKHVLKDMTYISRICLQNVETGTFYCIYVYEVMVILLPLK